MTTAAPHVGDTLPAAERLDAALELLQDGPATHHEDDDR